MLRLLKLGVMDFAGMDISKMAGDDPRFEACDLAGLTLTPDKARAACDAYRAVIDRQMQKNWGAKLLAFGANTPQVFWCREVIGGLEEMGLVLADLGHTVDRRDPRWGLAATDFVNVYLKGIEADYDRVPHPERLEPRTRGFKRLARGVPGAVLRRSLAQRDAHAARINEIFASCDVLMTPATCVPAVRIGRWNGQGALRTMIGMGRVYAHTPVWNYLGNPAASVPAGFTRAGLPLAVQLVAPPHREDVLVALAAQLEKRLGWPARQPPVAA